MAFLASTRWAERVFNAPLAPNLTPDVRNQALALQATLKKVLNALRSAKTGVHPDLMIELQRNLEPFLCRKNNGISRMGQQLDPWELFEILWVVFDLDSDQDKVTLTRFYNPPEGYALDPKDQNSQHLQLKITFDEEAIEVKELLSAPEWLEMRAKYLTGEELSKEKGEEVIGVLAFSGLQNAPQELLIYLDRLRELGAVEEPLELKPAVDTEAVKPVAATSDKSKTKSVWQKLKNLFKRKKTKAKQKKAVVPPRNIIPKKSQSPLNFIHDERGKCLIEINEYNPSGGIANTCRYEIVASIKHSGGENGGHYTCVEKQEEDGQPKFYMHNDGAAVRALSLKEIKSNLELATILQLRLVEKIPYVEGEVIEPIVVPIAAEAPASEVPVPQSSVPSDLPPKKLIRHPSLLGRNIFGKRERKLWEEEREKNWGNKAGDARLNDGNSGSE